MWRLFQWPKKKPSCIGVLKYKGDINTLVKVETSNNWKAKTFQFQSPPETATLSYCMGLDLC